MVSDRPEVIERSVDLWVAAWFYGGGGAIVCLRLWRIGSGFQAIRASAQVYAIDGEVRTWFLQAGGLAGDIAEGETHIVFCDVTDVHLCRELRPKPKQFYDRGFG
jgi:hypothetical protein